MTEQTKSIKVNPETWKKLVLKKMERADSNLDQTIMHLLDVEKRGKHAR